MLKELIKTQLTCNLVWTTRMTITWLCWSANIALRILVFRYGEGR